jgi:hypothetical protein
MTFLLGENRAIVLYVRGAITVPETKGNMA